MQVNNSKSLVELINKFLPYAYGAWLIYLFFIGSIGGLYVTPIFLSFTGGLFFVGLLILLNSSVKIPKNFWIYVVFLSIWSIHSYYLKGKVDFLMMYLATPFFWVISYNMRHKFANILTLIPVVVSITMIYLFIKTYGTNINMDITESLYHQTATSVHNHLGDILAVAILALFPKIMAKHPGAIIFSAIATVFISFSFSRSAIVSLICGILYIFRVRGGLNISNKFLPFVFVSMFIVFGVWKSTFSARPYYLNAIKLIPDSPMGIGVGNFANYPNNPALMHNLYLEILVGMGIFSMLFIAWLLRMARTTHFSNQNNHLGAVVIAIVVNFIFDRTYVIPAMVWLLFTFLGQAWDKDKDGT